jgi:hypothetical protein
MKCNEDTKKRRLGVGCERLLGHGYAGHEVFVCAAVINDALYDDDAPGISTTVKKALAKVIYEALAKGASGGHAPPPRG